MDEHNGIDDPANDDVYVSDSYDDIDEFELLDNRPKWPKVVGTISIVWGSLGLLCAGCGAVMVIATPMMLNMAVQQIGEDPPAIMLPSALLQVLAVVANIFPILLIFAGTMTCLRRQSGRTLHLAYALGSLVLTAISTAANLQHQTRIMEWAKQNPDSPWAQQSAPPAVTWSIFGAMLLLTLIWPIFTLIWFGFIKKTEHDFTGGVQEAAA